MRKRKNNQLCQILLTFLVICMLALLPKYHAWAEGSMFDSPYVVPYFYMDADGITRKYFTISQPAPIDRNLGETDYICHTYEEYRQAGTSPSFWLPEGTMVETGIESALQAINVGEHYYGVPRTGEIPIGRWVVRHRPSSCVHTGNKKEEWMGLAVGNDICKGAYYSGWLSYCADCGEVIQNTYVYAAQDRIETIRYLNIDYGYYYICQNPGCHHLENEGCEKKHICKQVSPNRYIVQYDGNGVAPDGNGGYADVAGLMLQSFHQYGNATTYEGRAVEPVTHLTKCSYSRTSYTFAGWNTEPDGSGISFEDGQEIYNLTEYNYLDENKNIDERGIVTLYAQWIKTESVLRIDPREGSYFGEAKPVEIKQGYGSSYLADPKGLEAKPIHTVSFQSNGGSAVAPMKVQRQFTSWRQEEPFVGKMRGNLYYFVAPSGNVDTLTALYENMEIVLPTPSRNGFYFGGWYEDPECTMSPAGFGGDPYLAKESITLYAKWSELTLWSGENYEANDRKGAADLKWEQPDARIKTYKLYQSGDGVLFSQIEGTDGGEMTSTFREYVFAGREQTFTTPSTGFYEFEVSGAKGGDHSATGKTGGSGGTVTAKFFLKKGDVLKINVGGTSGYGGGGKADVYAKGGGATTISSAKEGILIVAGGGGGATEFADGEAGGLEMGLRLDQMAGGENGSAGGGGGYIGGKAGMVIRHYHSDACKLDHVHGPECYVETMEERTCNILQKTPAYLGWQQDYGASAVMQDETCPVCKRVTKKQVIHFHVAHESCGAPIWGGPMANSDYGESFQHSTKHVCGVCGYIFAYFGAFDDRAAVLTHKYHVKEQKLICPIDLIHGCKYGYAEGQVISSSVAYGGSSYVKETAITFTKVPGANDGNGKVTIRSVSIGFSEGQELYGVPAEDLAAPAAISEKEIRQNALTDRLVDVSWAEPRDYGTAYWFRCESYLAETGEKISDSNVTKNMLTTGVAGYYYLLDQSPTTKINLENAQNAGEPLTESRIRCTLTSKEQYLHLAAVDIAGNIGPTTSVKLSGLEENTLSWPVSTGSVSIRSQDLSAENVYFAADGNIFVKADGITPCLFSFESYIQGNASFGYQITEQSFYLACDAPGQTWHFQTIVPKSLSPEGLLEETALPVADFIRYGSGEEKLLLDAGLTGATRGARGVWNSFWQGFFIPAGLSGRTIVVTPGAAAGEGENLRHSVWEEDADHALSFLADGVPPVITMSQDLTALKVINADDLTDRTLLFTASDDLSGLKSFTLTIWNLDNGIIQTFYGDDEGKIMIECDPEEMLFQGDVCFELTAEDHVSNQASILCGKKEFELEATIWRILEPHSPVFKRGESGILCITAKGYAERLEVEYPEAFGWPLEERQKSYVYPIPEAEVTEREIFMIPLYLDENGEYEIAVRAYKDGQMLEERPRLCTLRVVGSILEELRTRLR